jgi:uncharacterized protein YbjT (DUF2867 family)
MTTDNTILVIGATGKTGARVVSRLAALGHPYRAVSRRSEPAFDWENSETWAPALAGMKSAYITYVPDLATPNAPENIRRFAETAKAAGLKKLVLLSGRGEHGAELSEDRIRQSGLDFTIVRASWFNQNFSEGYLLDGVRAGEIALPAGAVLEPFIDADDIADVVVAALSDARHAGKLYEVTGPRALSFAQAVAEISTAAGRPIGYRQVSPEAFAAGMRPFVPEEVIALMDELFTVVLDGRNSSIADGVEQALGRPARDFADYARRTAATGVWRA